MNQGKLEMVKQEMATVNTNISPEMNSVNFSSQWTKMDENGHV